MNWKWEIVIKTSAEILAILVLLYLFLKILNESKTLRIVIQIFALFVVIGSGIIYTQKYLINV